MHPLSRSRFTIDAHEKRSLFLTIIHFLSQLSDLNRRPAHYEGAALPTELSWLVDIFIKTQK